MFTFALTAISLVLIALAGTCLVLRWMLFSDVSEHLVDIQDELNSFEWRFDRLAGHASNHFVGLSAESNRAIVEGRQIIDSMREYTNYLKGLVLSPNDENWFLAEKLMTGEVMPLLKKNIYGYKLTELKNWKERLENNIQVIGSDILKLSELYRKNIRPLNERVPTQVTDLVELGVRSAVNRMNIDMLRTSRKDREALVALARR